MKKFLTYLSTIICSINLIGQSKFISLYPNGDNPDIGYKSNMKPEIEKILFEANPILRMALYNNLYRRLQNGKNIGTVWYINFRSRIRMYNDNSKPVKLPSYMISLLAWQQNFRLKKFQNKYDNFLSYSFESGHYSNGQRYCAFSNLFEDGSTQCDSIYERIDGNSDLSKLLNRESGNFSTNFTEINFNYRLYPRLDEDYKPISGFSMSLGTTIYHDKLLYLANIGGYSDNDILIYGKVRLNSSISYFQKFSNNCFLRNKLKFDRLSLRYNYEYILDPHPSVYTSRHEFIISCFKENNFGIFLSGIYGHDNYNYRFVDKGAQVYCGITFDIFPPVEIKKSDE